MRGINISIFHYSWCLKKHSSFGNTIGPKISVLAQSRVFRQNNLQRLSHKGIWKTSNTYLEWRMITSVKMHNRYFTDVSKSTYLKIPTNRFHTDHNSSQLYRDIAGKSQMVLLWRRWVWKGVVWRFGVLWRGPTQSCLWKWKWGWGGGGATILPGHCHCRFTNPVCPQDGIGLKRRDTVCGPCQNIKVAKISWTLFQLKTFFCKMKINPVES